MGLAVGVGRIAWVQDWLASGGLIENEGCSVGVGMSCGARRVVSERFAALPAERCAVRWALVSRITGEGD